MRTFSQFQKPSVNDFPLRMDWQGDNGLQENPWLTLRPLFTLSQTRLPAASVIASLGSNMLPPPGLLGEFVIHSCEEDDGSVLLTSPMRLCRKQFQVACFDHMCYCIWSDPGRDGRTSFYPLQEHCFSWPKWVIPKWQLILSSLTQIEKYQYGRQEQLKSNPTMI